MGAHRDGAVRIGAGQAEFEASPDVRLVPMGAIGGAGGARAGVGSVRVGRARPDLRLVEMDMRVDEAGPHLAAIEVDAILGAARRGEFGDLAAGDAQIETGEPLGVDRHPR